MATILIVEDNEEIRKNLVEYLESKGYKTDNTEDGLQALGLVTLNQYDLILLDILIPGINGITLCKQLRSRNDPTPVIFLSAKDSTEERIEGLSAGADDYIVKPFSLSELLLRIRAVLRRNKKQEETKYQIADLVLNPNTKQVFRAGVELNLNPTLFRILEILMSRSPDVVSREDLENEIWGFQRVASDTLRTHMHLLRQQIDKPFDKALIKTRVGFGWVIKDE